MIIDRSVKWKTKFAFNLRVRWRRHEIGAEDCDLIEKKLVI